MATKVFLAYDERMTLHQPLPALSSSDESSADYDGPPFEEAPMEQPNRIRAIYKKLVELEATGGYRRFLEVPCLPATREVIELAHSPEHYDRMCRTMTMTDEQLRLMGVPNDLYFCSDTFRAARMACGGVVECVDAVTDDNRKSNRAMAIVRPPGHHATRDEAMGKSVFSNACARKFSSLSIFSPCIEPAPG
jgi:acetoin utilization deacetylase AcuC-like enzyme